VDGYVVDLHMRCFLDMGYSHIASSECVKQIYSKGEKNNFDAYKCSCNRFIHPFVWKMNPELKSIPVLNAILDNANKKLSNMTFAPLPIINANIDSDPQKHSKCVFDINLVFDSNDLVEICSAHHKAQLIQYIRYIKSCKKQSLPYKCTVCKADLIIPDEVREYLQLS
jgi:hypothetical protein